MIQRTVLKFITYLQRKRGKSGGGCQQSASGGKENAEPRGQENITKRQLEGTNLKDSNGVVLENREKPISHREDENELPTDLAYDIKNSEIMGRYLVASRDLLPGDLIIRADPLVVGPCAGCDIICLGCYHPIVSEDIYRCTLCKWPLCGPACPGLHQSLGHSAQECTILEEHSCPDQGDIKDLYHAIVPLRCLIYKASDPEKWTAINTMVAHNDIRKKKQDLWKYNQLMVVDRIRKCWGMPQYGEDEIHTICGILEEMGESVDSLSIALMKDQHSESKRCLKWLWPCLVTKSEYSQVNAFEVGPLGASLRALYPRAYLLAHDCTPNTTHTDDARHRLSVRAARPIKRGQPITLSYAYTLQNTHKRREHLLESKFFDCKCERCTDPQELGTYAGALLCPRCTNGNTKHDQQKIIEVTSKSNGSLANDTNSDEDSSASEIVGIVLPLDPLDQNASWKCDSCPNYTLSANLVKVLIQRISDEYDLIDCNDLNRFETFLHRYRNVLHPNHCLCLSAKLSLSQLYGKVDSHLIHQMTPPQLKRKRDICRDILKVFDVIEPGFSRLRGTTLYELHAPLMVLTTREYEKREITKAELRTRLVEVAKCLDESAKILNMEPPDSSEGIMATAARDALKQIKDWEKIIGKIL